MVAAYLVGSRGTARQAILLGVTVTVTHTIGVFALGLITLFASSFIVPDQLYPWLGVASGLLIAGMGAILVYRRLAALRRVPARIVSLHRGHYHPEEEPVDVRIRA
jgi:ABC-type nickel/cobalt efflux system permease component RcnA